MPPLRFDPAAWLLRLLEAALYLVTRTRVFPAKVEELGLDPARPVCYVLQYRHLTNLAVLTREARRLGLPGVLTPLESAAAPELHSRRAFFFLSRLNRDIGRDRAPQQVSSLMRRLVATALAQPDFDVQLVPVSILWGRAPGRQNSILKALFAESWRSGGFFRQQLAILMHGRHTVVRFSPPLSLRELLTGPTDAAHGERKLDRLLRVHFRRQREVAIGPDLSHRHTLVRTLLATEEVRQAIDAEAVAKKLPRHMVEVRARHMALEIAADYSYSVVRALELFLQWVWTRLYDGIELHGFDRVTSVAPGSGIVYVPCHRSHIDYLLLSSIIFRHGLTPPHIAAGANLDIPLVGPLLRRGGAFFLRRKLKGETLYTAIFVHYLHNIIERGFPVEYFIEGGRSRSGRTLPPKAGILGMTLRGHVTRPLRPLVFVPVYIGYEKLLEGRSYLAELGGGTKKSESLWGVLASVRQLRREFGKVHVNFGTPLAAAEILDDYHPEWRNGESANAPWLRHAIERTALTLAARINAAAVVTPVNLFALALLATPRHAAAAATLEQQIGHLQFLLDHAAYPGVVVPCRQDAAAIVAHALRLGFATVQPHPLGELIRADAEQAALLSYFRNNVLHLYVLPAILACLLSRNRHLSRQRALASVASLYRLLQAELFLPWPPEQIDGATDAAAAALAARGLLLVDEANTTWAAPEAGAEADEALRQIGETVRPLLQQMFLLLALLQRYGSGTVTRRQFEETAFLLAQRLAILHENGPADQAERSRFAHLLDTLIGAGLVSVDEQGRLVFAQQISEPAAHAELLLETEVRQLIRRLAWSGSAE